VPNTGLLRSSTERPFHNPYHVDVKRTSRHLYDYEVYLRQDWRGMGLRLGFERETGIGVAASRHANQTEFESDKYTMKEGKTSRGWER
jgi:hypothetical protein